MDLLLDVETRIDDLSELCASRDIHTRKHDPPL